MRELLMNARLICPLQNIDANGWLLIENGIIADSGNGTADSSIAADKITDCKGHIIGPSFVDMRVQSGYPGAEHLETMDSLLQSAASGGISTVVLLPSTLPVIDNAAIIDSLQVRADRANGPKVHCYGAMTKELKQEQMAELGLMAKAGAVGFASGTISIQSALSMYRIMNYAAMLDKPVIHHCEDFSLSENGDMNEGETSTRLGLLGKPALAETLVLERDVQLAEATGVHYHASHISTAGAVEIVRQAKQRGLKITADTAPPYFTMNEVAVSGYDTRMKMNPPLRCEEDREAIVDGLSDGTIDAVASDHIPVNPDMKNQPFTLASCGGPGLETVMQMTAKLVHGGQLSWQRAFEVLSTGPARILKLDNGSLKTGKSADLVQIDPNAACVIDAQTFKSLSRISPFDGQPCEGKVNRLWIDGISCLPDTS